MAENYLPHVGSDKVKKSRCINPSRYPTEALRYNGSDNIERLLSTYSVPSWL